MSEQWWSRSWGALFSVLFACTGTTTPNDAPSSEATADTTSAESGSTDTLLEASAEASVMDASSDAALEVSVDSGPETCVVDGGGQDPTRPLAPASTAYTSSTRPTFRWRVGCTDSAPSGVRLCRDRAMSAGCQTLTPTSGASSARPASPLAAGVWFWQLQGTRSGAAPLWQCTVGVRDTPVDSASGTVLDSNGDGLADLVVASTDVGAQGHAHVYYGSATGPRAMPDLTLTSSGAVNDGYGAAVANAGDLNGDGFADLVVGAPLRERAYVYYGSATGFRAMPDVSLVGPDSGFVSFAQALAGAGDLNGDGFGELVVGARYASTNEGRAHVYYGSATGIRAMPDVSLVGPDGPGGVFGWSVAGAGDVNGDGFADLAVGAEGVMAMTGRAHVYYGSAAGLRPTPDLSLTGPDGINGAFAFALAGAGDLNGDGYSDLASGGATPIPVGPGYLGHVHVFYGSATGLRAMPGLSLAGPDGAGGGFGTALTIGGDLNSDGFADLVVGAPGAMSGAGRAHVYLGSMTGPRAMPDLSLTGPAGAGGTFGSSAVSAGDLNGDGVCELAVGSPGASRAYVFNGRATGLRSMFDLSLGVPDANTMRFGGALACLGGGLRRVPAS